MNTNVPTTARRGSAWAALSVCLAASFTVGLFTGKSMWQPNSLTPTVAATAHQQVAASVMEFYPIVASPVIDPQPKFFYGTGDGNGGYSGR